VKQKNITLFRRTWTDVHARPSVCRL